MSQTRFRDAYDVIVVGGGNAGLVAALSARHIADSVLLVERAPEWRRGGNSRHTRDIRYAHAAGEPYTNGEEYSTDELLDDLLQGGRRRQPRDGRHRGRRVVRRGASS